jgi:hypothetical protein
LARTCLSTEAIQTSPCWWTAKLYLFYLVFHNVTHLNKIRLWVKNG